MTLIIGIKCTDGIVMGADGAATFGDLGTQTIRQPTTKLEVIEKRIIVGVSGPIGLGQRITAEVQSQWIDGTKKLGDKTPTEAMTALRLGLWKHIEQEMNIARAAGTMIGQAAWTSALTSTLVALPVKGGPSLIQFNQQGRQN